MLKKIDFELELVTSSGVFFMMMEVSGMAARSALPSRSTLLSSIDCLTVRVDERLSKFLA